MTDIWVNSNDAQWLDIYPPVSSFVNGCCTDRYGVPIDVVCQVHIWDYDNKIIAYGTTQSGTGIFSIEVQGKNIDSKVLVGYSYEGTYHYLTDIAGAEFMTTSSGSIL